MHAEDRAKPRELKPSVKRLIFQEAISQKKVPRELLAKRLIKEIEEANEIAPTVETAKRYISKARNADNPLDKPWTLGACRDYPNFFPPSSLFLLLEFQSYVGDFVDSATGERGGILPIRQAIWITRLQPIINELFDNKLVKPDDCEAELDLLYDVSYFYASAERTSETMEESTFNTADLDNALYSKNLSRFSLSFDPDDEIFEELSSDPK